MEIIQNKKCSFLYAKVNKVPILFSIDTMITVAIQNTKKIIPLNSQGFWNCTSNTASNNHM